MTPPATVDLKEWERHFTLPDGCAVHVRPIRPEDEPLYGPFLKAVSADDVRMRFLGPMKELTHAQISYFTHVDHARAMAFIALDEASGEMIGVARLHDDAGNESAEYAIIVRSDLKSHGLGWQLMQLLIAYGRAKGLRAIYGQVLHENKTMLKMCGELGFEITMNPDDPSISDVRLDLR